MQEEAHRAAMQRCDWPQGPETGKGGGRGHLISPGGSGPDRLPPQRAWAEQSTTVRLTPGPTRAGKEGARRLKQKTRLAVSVTWGLLVGPREHPGEDAFHLSLAGPLEEAWRTSSRAQAEFW